RPSLMEGSAREATAEYSKGQAGSRVPPGALPPALWAGLLAAAVAGGILLIAADFSTLYEVKAITAVLKRQSGHAQHSYGLVVLGIAALAMTFGAARSRSRPAMLAVGAIGLLALLI